MSVNAASGSPLAPPGPSATNSDPSFNAPLRLSSHVTGGGLRALSVIRLMARLFDTCLRHNALAAWARILAIRLLRDEACPVMAAMTHCGHDRALIGGFQPADHLPKMNIYRFDEEIGLDVDRFGSRFRIGPLTGDNTRARVQVLYLPPQGLIGRHETVLRQLFAVVSGTGWVAGEDRARRDVSAGYAAVWEEGESHEAGTDTGLTAISIEGSFDVWALEVTKEIVVCDYDPAWPAWFAELHDRLWPALEDLAVRIDHVGSTSVPGLAAKPVIDMDIVVSSPEGIRPVIDRLTGLGYRWRGDLGVTGREAFAPPVGQELPAHHLYLVVEGNKAHLDHILLRDLLRRDPTAREAYAALKRRNVDIAQGDMDRYVAAKAGFVAGLLTRARQEQGLPPATYWVPDEAS